MGEPHAALCKFVNIRCLIIICTIAAYFTDAIIIGKDKKYIRFFAGQ